MGKRKKLPKILNKEEQEKLIEVFNTRYPSQYRNKTMIILMLDTGLRLSEIINLKWKHINIMSGEIKVIEGKGAKDRALWINENTLEKLKKWKKIKSEELSKRK